MFPHPDFIEGVARAALEAPRASLVAAVMRPIAFEALNPATAGLWRCEGAADVGRTQRRFSAVVKIAQRPADEPDSLRYWNSWKREALFYASGHRGVREQGLTIPRFYGETAGAQKGQRCLWLEDVGDPGGRWSLPQHARAARALGEFGAANLGRVPRAPWVSRDWLRQALEGRDAWHELLADPKTWADPKVKRAFEVPVQLRVLHLYQHAGALLDALDALPQTLCHFDAYRANLFARGSRTVAIDWAFVGEGALGVDLGQMIAGDLMWLLVPVEQGARYLDAVLAGYLRGVQRARVKVKPEQVRRAAFISAALRVACYFPYLLMLLRDPPSWRRRFAGPLAQSTARFGRAVELLLSLAQREWPAS
ncbi:MAG: hypothetical protein IPJ65_21035 [Archangiaceae bacterium]|nr:hypothetical protein [Archangiaceae bacterium]